MVNFEYGLSLACSEDCEVPLLPERSVFTSLELPGHFLEKNLRQRKIPRIVNMIDIIPSSLARGVVDQDKKIIQNFKLQLADLITKMNAMGIFSFSMDNGMESVPGDSAHSEKLVSFIKSITPVLYEKKTFMNLPLRIPETFRGSSETYLKFKTDLMSPFIRFAVNVYPHELRHDYSPDELLRFFRFDIGILRIMYEPEIGNRLVEKHVQPWVEYLEKNNFEGNLVFCPRTSSPESLADEISFLTEFIAGI
ncbi:MAG: hypothetical protein A2020_14905 [Lentisphaerae bacterium GWF2_45_14]|nr:MAG: hypothetical protein A2020_14905 [Lentisphaerae bacterium GWF2_45_14]